MRNLYEILVGKPRRRREDDIKMDLRNSVGNSEMDSSG
jgi:hypothetical protein